MKGKKFSAAEKHFQEKEVKLRKEVQRWQTRAIEQSQRVEELERSLKEANNIVEQQRDWIERLLQYTELSKEDIKAACEKDKSLAACAEMILGASSFWKF